MQIAHGPTRRAIVIVGCSFIIAVIFVTAFRNQPFAPSTPAREWGITPDLLPGSSSEVSRIQTDLTGPAIAPKLGNETVKAELGRAAWKLFHTTMARFPDSPTTDQSEALRSYIHLFQRLYPCGECAEHFGQILEKYPPQVSSRSAAAGWACHVHNEVNKSLEKEMFDCSKIGDFYDCGCADDKKEEMSIAGQSRKEESVMSNDADQRRVVTAKERRAKMPIRKP